MYDAMQVKVIPAEVCEKLRLMLLTRWQHLSQRWTVQLRGWFKCKRELVSKNIINDNNENVLVFVYCKTRLVFEKRTHDKIQNRFNS